MKKIFALLFLSVLMSFAISSCGGEKEEPPEDEVAMEDIGRAYDDSMDTEDEMSEEEGAAEEQAADEPKRTDYSSSPLMGQVVSFNELVLNQDGVITADQAKDLVSRGQLLAFKADNGKVYFLYNADGSYAAKKMAQYAGAKVGVYGTVKKVKNLNLFIVKKFETVS